jgi:tetrathionate reductase subunit B
MESKKRYGFVIDIQRCIDCRACLVACRAENEVEIPNTRIWVRDLGVNGVFPALSHSFVPYNCMHCDEPPCVEVCTSGATYKDPESGLVLVDQEACIGCGFCIEACPYDARYRNNTLGVVDKCNACVQRVEVGQQPACVATCLGGSRMFGDLNDPGSEVSKALKAAASATRLVTANVNPGPNIYYINADAREMEKLSPREPRYTVAETFWRRLAIPAVLAGVGLSFLGQAIAFTKQLLGGEEDFEE